MVYLFALFLKSDIQLLLKLCKRMHVDTGPENEMKY